MRRDSSHPPNALPRAHAGRALTPRLRGAPQQVAPASGALMREHPLSGEHKVDYHSTGNVETRALDRRAHADTTTGFPPRYTLSDATCGSKCARRPSRACTGSLAPRTSASRDGDRHPTAGCHWPPGCRQPWREGLHPAKSVASAFSPRWGTGIAYFINMHTFENTVGTTEYLRPGADHPPSYPIHRQTAVAKLCGA